MRTKISNRAAGNRSKIRGSVTSRRAIVDLKAFVKGMIFARVPAWTIASSRC